MSKLFESSPGDLQNLSISCSNVPDALLDKNAAKHYFQKFGRVMRIRLRPRQKICIIEFANEESAQTAYAESGEYDGQNFIVSWTKPKKEKRKIIKKLQDPNWSDDPDIKEELEAMKGNSFTINKNYNLRPEAMVTEQIQNAPKKPLALKKTNKIRQWKGDKPSKPKYSESMPFLSHMSEQETELLKIIMTVATSSEEKFRVLDARDKLIRLKTVRQSELAIATRTVGTCPDMCPEKERLMREVQHQVAAYEHLAGSAHKNAMNHSLAVKQYSRSSADQEAPLAHELRPVDVLQLTMGYLMHRIMDLCDTQDVNLAEWYHFVWDRTRGIRKDVTQQELCCEKSVQLVEQCARFHVHCAARLVAEDISVFDDKINTENLTKCLQTLKYMYHDLKVKHGITCPNEAEFRAYIVLLNLNDGNFMWEVQELSPDIQQSQEIRFALKVYSALDKNNYVRFFKLVKSTTYLNACILLRYFNQVRYRALLTIIKSYSPRSPCTQYPLEELYRSLAFEDLFSTIAFMEYHGLQLNDEKTYILLDRNRFKQPDLSFGLERAINIVESKRQISVGETVCGETLPEKIFERHIPHNSFDDSGYIKLAELPKDFQGKYQQFLKQFGQNLYDAKEEFLDEQEKSDEEMQEDQYMEEKLDTKKPFSFIKNSTDNVPSKLQENKPKVGGFVFQLPTKIVAHDVSERDGEIPSLFGAFKSKNLEDNRSQSPLMHLATKSETVKPFWTTNNTKPVFGDSSKSIFKNTVNDKPQISSIFAEVKKSDFKEESHKNFKAENKSGTKAPLNNIPTSQPFTINQTLSESKSFKPIEPNFNFKQQEKASESLKQHKSELLEKERLMKEELIKRFKEQEESKAKKLAEEKRLNELRKLEEIKSKKELEKKKVEELLDIKIKSEVKLIIDNLLSKVENDFIKTRLSEISENIKMRKVLQFGRKWKNISRISRKKRKNFFDNPVWISSRSVSSEAEELYTPSQVLTLHDIKRYKLGIPNEIKIKEYTNIKKLNVYKLIWKILFEQLSCNNKFSNLNIYWKVGISVPNLNEEKSGLERLDKMLQAALDWNQTNYGLMTLKKVASNNGGSLNYCLKKLLKYENNLNGLIFIHIGHNCSQYNINRLQNVVNNKNTTSIPLAILIKDNINHRDLVNYIEKNNLTKYELFYFNENNFEIVLSSCLIYLAGNYVEYYSNLQMDELSTVLRNCLAEELWFRIRSSAEINKRFSLLLQDPNNVIELHNEALFYCFDLLFDKSINNLPNFPKEFTEFVKDEGILLPCTYEYFPDYWNKEEYLMKLKKIVQSFKLPKFSNVWPPKNEVHLQEIVQEYCLKIFEKNTAINVVYKILSIVLKNLKGSFENNFNLLSWIDIVELVTLEKLNTIKFNDNLNPIFTIVYNYIEMKDFRKVPWWFQLENIEKKIKMIKYEEEFSEPEILMDDSFTNDIDMDLNKTMDDLNDKYESNDDNNKMKSDYDHLTSLLEDLEKSMDIQKKIMAKFQEKALEALDI